MRDILYTGTLNIEITETVKSVLKIFQKSTGGSSVGFGSGADLNENSLDPERCMVHAAPYLFT
jgi:hypothetical protein